MFYIIFPALSCFSVSWEMVSRFCLNFPFLFSFSFFFSTFSFSFITFLFWCIWKNVVFFHRIGEDIFCFFSSYHFSFLLFLFFLFLKKKMWLILLFLNSFWNSLLILLLSSHFLFWKNQPRNLHFLFLFSPFSVSLFFFQHFSLFSIITFSLIIFSFHPFVHPFLLFSPFSLLSFLHSFFISLSHVSLTFFLHRRCCVSSFYFNSFFFSPSLSLLILISLFSYFFSRFLLHLRLCFFQKKIQNYLWSMFRRRNYVFIFWTLPLSVLNLVCFSSLRRHFSLFVLCFLFFRFFIVTFLDHRYFSWFSFFNLLLGLFKKNGLFSRKKSSKISFFCLFSFWKKSLLFFFLEIKFCYTFVFSCMISKTLCHFLCFQSLPFLGGKFLVSLCFCPLQKNLWKVMDALYFFSLLILDSFSLYVSSRYDYSPCCCSACWQKNWSKKTCVLLFFFAQSSKKKKLTKTVFSFRKYLPFLFFFYSLPFKKSIFANKHMFYQFYRFVSLSL